MALSQSALKSVWAPACRGPWAKISLHGAGQVTVRPAAREAVEALNACLRVWNYRTRYSDTGAYVCRSKVSGNGYSLHAYGIALDLNWRTNPFGRRLITDMPAGMRSAIKGIRTNNGRQVWSWGGDWSGTVDAMHWELACSPQDLATGINWRTVPGSRSVTLPNPPAPVVVPLEDDVTPEDINRIAELTAQKVWDRQVPAAGSDYQPAKLVLRDVFVHARRAAGAAEEANKHASLAYILGTYTKNALGAVARKAGVTLRDDGSG